MTEKFPHIPADLLAALDQHFPERSAELTWSEKQVWFKGGNREVIRFLRAKFTEQNESITKRDK